MEWIQNFWTDVQVLFTEIQRNSAAISTILATVLGLFIKSWNKLSLMLNPEKQYSKLEYKARKLQKQLMKLAQKRELNKQGEEATEITNEISTKTGVK